MKATRAPMELGRRKESSHRILKTSYRRRVRARDAKVKLKRRTWPSPAGKQATFGQLFPPQIDNAAPPDWSLCARARVTTILCPRQRINTLVCFDEADIISPPARQSSSSLTANFKSGRLNELLARNIRITLEWHREKGDIYRRTLCMTLTRPSGGRSRANEILYTKQGDN